MGRESEMDPGLKRLIDAREAGDLDVLLEALRSDPDYGNAAARMLAHAGEQRAVPILVELLGSERATLRAAAVRALEQLGAPPEARAQLVEIALHDSVPSARAGAATAIGGYADAEASRLLLELLGDANRAVRIGAAKGLVLVGDPAAIPAILAARPSVWRSPTDWMWTRRALKQAALQLHFSPRTE